MKNFTYRIYYEDTDAGGVVYYANYLKFYERARTDFLRELGISQSQLAQSYDVLFVVNKFDVHYLKPAKLDDLIEVSVEISKINAFFLEIEQKITCNNILLNRAKAKIAMVSANNFNLKEIPNEIKNKISDV